MDCQSQVSDIHFYVEFWLRGIPYFCNRRKNQVIVKYPTGSPNSNGSDHFSRVSVKSIFFKYLRPWRVFLCPLFLASCFGRITRVFQVLFVSVCFTPLTKPSTAIPVPYSKSTSKKRLLLVLLACGLFLTDTYPQVQYQGAAHYSLRRTVPGYTGPLVQVRHRCRKQQY